jgi:hypothetical protein
MNLGIKKEKTKLISIETSKLSDSLFSASLLVGEQLTGQVKESSKAETLKIVGFLMKSKALATVCFTEKKQFLDMFASQKSLRSTASRRSLVCLMVQLV